VKFTVFHLPSHSTDLDETSYWELYVKSCQGNFILVTAGPLYLKLKSECIYFLKNGPKIIHDTKYRACYDTQFFLQTFLYAVHLIKYQENII
jgi:hypothetical protein